MWEIRPQMSFFKDNFKSLHKKLKYKIPNCSRDHGRENNIFEID